MGRHPQKKVKNTTKRPYWYLFLAMLPEYNSVFLRLRLYTNQTLGVCYTQLEFRVIQGCLALYHRSTAVGIFSTLVLVIVFSQNLVEDYMQDVGYKLEFYWVISRSTPSREPYIFVIY